MFELNIDVHLLMITRKEAEMVLEAVSAKIRELQQEQLQAEKKGLNIGYYTKEIAKYQQLKSKV